jgi:hypothetical protein
MSLNLSNGRSANERLSPELLEQIRARVSLAELVGRTVALRSRGRELLGLCPFHDERSPSFTVCEDKGFWHCFGCSAHGDAFDWLMRLHGLPFRESVEQLAIGLPLQGSSTPPQSREQQDQNRARDQQWAREIWAGSRPASGTIVERYLREARSLPLSAIGGVPSAIRLVDELPYWHHAEGWPRARVIYAGPAMVAAMIDNDRQVLGVHRTWLASDGSGKATIADPDGGAPLNPRKMLGQHCGTVIPMTPLAAAMQGGEGIETTLAGFCLVPELPAVALGSLGNFAGRSAPGHGGPHPRRAGVLLPNSLPDLGAPGWLPPPGTREFTWLADMDGADLYAAEKLIARGAARLLAAGIEAKVARPPLGLDFNDWAAQVARMAA